MLRLKHIRMSNFGIHEKIDQSLDGGIIGLSGLNGSGKSTVLQAIQYALTGKIDHDDNLSDFIRRVGKKPPKSANVELDFEVDGRPAKISRTITRTSTSREFHWDGKVLTADAAVSATMRELLGVDAKAINSTVFIRQGSFMDLFAGDTERMEFYTRLLMLQHLDKLADVVDSHRKRVADKVKDLGPVRDANETAYNTAKAAYDEALADLGAYPDKSAQLAHLSNIIGHFKYQVSLEHEAASAKAAFEAAQVGNTEALHTRRNNLQLRVSELDSCRDAWNSYTGRRSCLVVSISDLEADAAVWTQLREIDTQIEEQGAPANIGELRQQERELNIALRAFSIQPSLAASVAELVQVLETDQARLDKGRAELPSVQSAHQDARDSVMRLKSDIAMLSELSNITKGHTHEGACIACGSKNPDAGFVSGRLQERLSDLAPAEAALSDAEKKLSAFNSGISKLESLLATNRAELERKRKELSDATLITLTYGSEAEVAEKLESVSASVAKAQAQEGVLRALRQTRARLKQSLRVPADSFDDAKLIAMKRELEKLETTKPVEWDTNYEKEVNDKRAEIESLRVSLARFDSASAAYDLAKTQLATAEASLQKAISEAAIASPELSGQSLSYENVSQMHADVLAYQEDRQRKQGAASAKREALVDADRALQEINDKIEGQKRRIELVAKLKRIQDAFRPSGALSKYLDYKFGHIARLAGDYLASSSANFMVAPSTTRPLSYEFLRTNVPDAVWLDQNRFSGGQKVRLAVATLRAIHAMIMPNVGLLVLDEPTTHVDYVVKENLAQMLRQISEEGTLQVIVCDHDPVVMDAADVMIEL